ncbi:MAG: M81 family metallopeptidase, partial [Erysipelotrichaceae bacterium]|nr:M81 family metallopeptidase [Erysipelotrichaceae bacterium]
MKILGFKFTLEANENVPVLCDIENVAFQFYHNSIYSMHLDQYPFDEDVQFLPILNADPGSSGVMKSNCFKYIETRILETIKEHLKDLDGLYLHFHGASFIENLGSGDFHLLKEIRKITGPYLPIAVTCDPHGNLCKEYVENTQLIRSYRHSPHTDVKETAEFVMGELIDLIRHPQHIHSIYRKLPLILGGEQSVSLDEPVRTINQFLEELEKDPRVRSASWHVGYIRHDCPEAGCGIVVVPQTEQDQKYCEKVADELAEFVWNKRHEFHYTGVTAHPDEALKMVLSSDAKPNFITDSGDNVTSGSAGVNTFVLRQVLELPQTQKRFLFASICDV